MIAAIIVPFGTSELVTCIECDTAINPICFDDFGKDKRNLTETCKGTVCYKRKIIDFDKKVQNLRRGCKIKVKGDKDDCSKKDYQEGGSKSKRTTFRANYCVCNKDFCNNSNDLSTNYVLIISLFITNIYSLL